MVQRSDSGYKRREIVYIVSAVVYLFLDGMYKLVALLEIGIDSLILLDVRNPCDLSVVLPGDPKSALTACMGNPPKAFAY